MLDNARPNQFDVTVEGLADTNAAAAILEAVCKDKVSLSITRENVQGVLEAATFLQCRFAEELASDFLLSKTNTCNAFQGLFVHFG